MDAQAHGAFLAFFFGDAGIGGLRIVQVAAGGQRLGDLLLAAVAVRLAAAGRFGRLGRWRSRGGGGSGGGHLDGFGGRRRRGVGFLRLHRRQRARLRGRFAGRGLGLDLRFLRRSGRRRGGLGRGRRRQHRHRCQQPRRRHRQFPAGLAIEQPQRQRMQAKHRADGRKLQGWQGFHEIDDNTNNSHYTTWQAARRRGTACNRRDRLHIQSWAGARRHPYIYWNTEHAAI